MALDGPAAAAKARDLIDIHLAAERPRLELIHQYVRPRTRAERQQSTPWWLNTKAPAEVKRLAGVARVNMLRLVVASTVQAMYVDGFRVGREADNVPAWGIWQANRFDARQIGVHRAGVTYGAAYVTVLPGDPTPVLRGASPRSMIVTYDEDDDWPAYALEKRNGRYRLFDEEHVHTLRPKDKDTSNGWPSGELEYVASNAHDLGVTPVVRFRETDDLDVDVCGVVEPLLELQDQIDITTFGLLVAQHYGAFRQRYVMGWLADSEEAKLKASASNLWTFDDPETKVGEFGQTNLKGYLESRESTLRHLATISQTPVHELLGQLINMSAEALAAAEAGYRRAITQFQTVMGESHEQVLDLAGQALDGGPTDPSAEIRWKDTESRSLAQVADALGKLATMLGVPPQELWERIPGVTQQELERWKATAASGDALGNLTRMLEQQAAGEAAPA